MSDDNNNSEPFDFDFDALNQENPPEKPEESFDLDNPFGDDIVVSSKGVSADNPYLDGSAVYNDSTADVLAEESEQTSDAVSEEPKKTKKGFWGSKGKTKTKNVPKEKKEKVVKEKKPLKDLTPRDMGTALCVAFTLFLFASMLVFNIAAFFTSGSSMMQTLCFLGAFNIVGLALIAVPLLFYKFPQERTLPNVLLGISVVAIFSGVLILLTEFSNYSFILKA